MSYPTILFKALFKSIRIFTIGLLLTISGFFLALFIGSSMGMGGAHATHAGGIGAAVAMVVGLFGVSLWAGILLVATPVFAWSYSALAFQAFIKTSIFHVWKGKLSSSVISKVDTSLKRFFNGKAGAVTNKADLKVNMLKELSTDKSAPFVQRKVIKYALKKVDLSDVDTSEPQYLSSVITEKVKSSLENIEPPSSTLFLVLLVGHILLMIISFMTKH